MSSSATRCTVCGTDLSRGRQTLGPRGRSEITLSLPLALIVLAIFTLLSAGLTFAAVRFAGSGPEAEPTETATPTPTATSTIEPTPTNTPQPTWTPRPPIAHTIIENETCLGLAAYYDVSVRSIQDLNPRMRCEMLSVGEEVLVPYPTYTPTPEPTATLSTGQQTEVACEKVNYTVVAGDTLAGIAANYNVEMQGIREFNGMSNQIVFEGQALVIPLCRRLPTPGPTPTPTPPPPYPAPNLLLPRDGEAFTLAADTVTLQWAAVSALRDNEYYQVTILDVTEGSGTKRWVDQVKDTKYIAPTSMRPNETLPHVLRWWVTTVRQIGTRDNGDPIFTSAGAISAERDFTWSGAAVAASPTP